MQQQIDELSKMARDSQTTNRKNVAVSMPASFTQKVQRTGREHWRSFPWRNKLPFWQGLVTEFLLQRTRAQQVAPVFKAFRRRYPNAKAFAAAPEEEIRQLAEPLGLRWRGALLYRLAQEIGARNGRLPRDYQELQRLPGVGPYAAAAALSLHGNTRAVIIDSNIVRLLCRVKGVPYDGETRRKRWLREFAESLTPEKGFREYNYALLDLAMEVCRPRNPACEECPVNSMCRSTGTFRPTSDDAVSGSS